MASGGEPSTPKKLSGAELKALKKAEKAAARAQKKDDTVTVPLSKAALSKAEQHQKKPDKQQQKPPKGRPNQSTSETSDSRSQRSQQAPTAKPSAASSTPKPTEPHRVTSVSVFAHLYDKPKRHTVPGASKDVHPAIQALGLQFSTYEVCGSSARCIAMLLALKQVIHSYSTPAGNSLARHLTTHHLSPQIEFLKSCRPLSISMGNAIRWLKDIIIKIDPSTPEAEAKETLISSIDGFIRDKFILAGKLIAEQAAQKIVNNDVILTYAKSTIVLKSILEAKNQGKDFRVIVVDSKPLFEGKEMAKDLVKAGITVSYYPITGAAHAVEQASKVLLGAHAMLSNGILQSRVGTSLIAMHAKALSIPVLVCCESIKFTEQVALESITKNEISPPDELLGKLDFRSDSEAAEQLMQLKKAPNLQMLNIMYDFADSSYIYLIVTEHGSLPPSSVPAVLRSSGSA